MSELKIQYTLKKEDYWLRKSNFIEKNPAGNLPILENEDNNLMIGYYPIIEFLNDFYSDFHLMSGDHIHKSKIRQQIYWFNDKFYREVSKIIVDEKMIRPISRVGEPRSDYIRIAKNNLQRHFSIIEKILEKTSYLESEKITCADITAASHIAIIDYFGEIYWDRWPSIKHWYSVIKSRPSFQLTLSDRVPGLEPPKYYSDPDF